MAERGFTDADVARAAADLESREREFMDWLGPLRRHIDVVSKPRLMLVRKGLLSVETSEREFYAWLTPLGLAVRAFIQEKDNV